MVIKLLREYARPVFVSLVYVARSVFIPFILYILIEVQVKLAIYNRPGIRINISRGPTAYRISSVASVLRSELARIFLKHFKVFLAGKEPLGIIPFELIFI